MNNDEFITFSLGGLVIFLYELLLTVVLTELFGIWFMYSYFFALLTGLGFLFLFHFYITFNMKKVRFFHIEKFLVNYLIMYFFSFFLVLVVTSKGIHYLISIILISIIVSILNYFINKTWVFQEE